MRSCSKLILIVILALSLMFLFNSLSRYICHAYFVETPEREFTYNRNGVTIKTIEYDDFLFLLTSNDKSPYTHKISKIDKSTNMILEDINIPADPNSEIHYTDMKVILNFIFLSGYKTGLFEGHLIYRPIRTYITLDFISQYTSISNWYINHDVFNLKTIIADNGDIYLGYSEYESNCAILYKLSYNHFYYGPEWSIITQILDPIFRDLQVSGNYVYVALDCNIHPLKFIAIKKYNTAGEYIKTKYLNVSQYYDNQFDIGIEVKNDIIIIATQKLDYIDNEKDKIIVKVLDLEFNQIIPTYIFNIDGRVISIDVKLIENDIYLSYCYYTIGEQFPWLPENTIVKVISMRSDEMRLNRIKEIASSDYYNDPFVLLESCIYTRDSVYLESKEMPISQKRLFLAGTYCSGETPLIKFFDFWIPKDTMSFITFVNGYYRTISLGVENYETYLSDFGEPNPNLWYYGTGSCYYMVPLLTGERLEPNYGYFSWYTGDNLEYAITGKEILYREYEPHANCNKMWGFGTYPGFVLYSDNGNPVLLCGIDPNDGSYYWLQTVNGDLTHPNEGYIINEISGMNSYFYIVDQTEQ
ncbi:MAG: hypothetical protein ACFFDY_01105 [Candidatus Thorarchaeota archaeon]